MNKKYFKLTNEKGVFNGVIENIPTETLYATVADRIETKTDTEEIVLVDEELPDVDIVMDWESIDYEHGLDADVVALDNVLAEAIARGLETEVVYTALKEMKLNSEASIEEIVLKVKKEWL